MVVVNTPDIPGRKIEVISLVTGACIMSRHIGKDIGSSFRNLVGGEMGSYVDMLNEAKDIAIQRMIENAQQLGADAIVNVRFSSSSIVQGGAEILVAGTAAKIVG